MPHHLLRRAAFLAALLCVLPATAQDMPAADRTEAATPDTAGAARLPAAVTSRHSIEIEGERLDFAAVAGALVLASAEGREEAEIAYVAYMVETEEPASRPVTFAVNGGPGAASAYLHLGALGPWLLPMEGGTISPSQPVDLVDNEETWLAFTDLVFVDPVGTGFSRLIEPDDRLRGRYLSINGDIAALGRFIADWLAAHGRTGAPVLFVGESYGGFRGPLLAETLQTENGIGLAAMALVSPVLDFGWWQQPPHAPLPAASLLPSLAAAGMEREGEHDEARLAEAEDYAAGAFVTDWLIGVEDEAAARRMSARVAELTGLPLEIVAREAGRIDRQSFTRELFRDEGRLASIYDAAITSPAPGPGQRGRAADPVLDAMTAPLTGAMLDLYRERLGWLPDRRYILLNRGINRAWDWGSGRGQPEALSALARVMALDEEFRLLVVHGTADLVTPYFASTLLLRQIPFGDRIVQENYRGGHMFYTRPESRRAFRDAGAALIGGDGAS